MVKVLILFFLASALVCSIWGSSVIKDLPSLAPPGGEEFVISLVLYLRLLVGTIVSMLLFMFFTLLELIDEKD